MKQIREQSFICYKNFVFNHCPKDDKGEPILCKGCNKWKNRCTHRSHPKNPLFEEVK